MYVVLVHLTVVVDCCCYPYSVEYYVYTYFLMLQEASKALEIGSSVLLPPVLDRMDILLSILPEEPANIATLTAGQVQQGA